MVRKEGGLKAAIDIGSNTVLLLVGAVNGGKVEFVHEEQHAPRLGKGVDAEKNLAKGSITKAIDALLMYKKILTAKFPEVEEVSVTATSAVRDAANKHYFLKKVSNKTGFTVKVLSGEEEAAYTFFGAKSVLKNVSGISCVLDIGGGSTEVAIGNKRILKDRYSYDIGSVRFTERYLLDDPPSAQHLKECRMAIRAALKEKVFYFPSLFSLIGVAGTVTSLAHLEAGLDTYSPEKVNGKTLSIETLSRWVLKIKEQHSEQLLLEYPEILKGRADVILGGLLILECFMKSTRIPKLIISTGGIRHGALLMSDQ